MALGTTLVRTSVPQDVSLAEQATVMAALASGLVFKKASEGRVKFER